MRADLEDFILYLATERGLSDNYQISTRLSLEGFASWVAGALSAYKIELESIADGVTLEHCIDAFEGVSLRICACGKRWATRMALERDGVASVGFGCELCGLVWTIPELEKAHAARGKS